MKRSVICVILVLALLLSGCSRKITVEADLKDMELEGPESWKTGEEYEAELIPDDDYILPEKITVRVGGDKLSAKDYEYDSRRGDLTIPAEAVTGDIEITGKAEEITLVGKWVADVDLTELLAYWLREEQNLEELYDVFLYEYYQGLSLRVILEFGKTETYCVTVDENSLNALERKLYTQTEKAQSKNFLEDYMELRGISSDDVAIDLFMEEYGFYDFLAMVWFAEDSGDYEEENGTLYFEWKDGVRYYLDGKTLTLKYTGDYDLVGLVFPMVFTRSG